MKTITLATSDPVRGAGAATRRDPYAAEGGAVDTGTVIATRPSIRPVASAGRGVEADWVAKVSSAPTAHAPTGRSRLTDDRSRGLLTREVV